ncbi:MAG: hypothetical protein M0Z65_12795 [Firmicutes bacterium]|uniref:CarD family transcriptional regulator n=1 Tax=Melghirimyces thermohalophilus TaxID=1236220 RepID=UPI001FDEC405|nr:CarD family transcriptional regulator [Melghirimyces thermohalophilus]MDA8354024.1 hypothetical protein [Bacillota bacterium]
MGDKIMYPLFGAGVIKDIEEKEVLGEEQLYCVLNMLLGEMNMMIPVNQMEKRGIRKVVDVATMESALQHLYEGESDLTIPWNQRYRINMDKMKSGDLYQETEVIRDLTRISKSRSLGTGEKKMLDDATKILISELALVKGIEQEQAADLFQDVVLQG